MDFRGRGKGQQARKDRDQEGRGFSRSGLGLSGDVLALKRDRKRPLLYLGALRKADASNAVQDRLRYGEILKVRRHWEVF